MPKRYCPDCEHEKPDEAFYSSVRHVCKACHNARARAYYWAHRDDILARQAEQRQQQRQSLDPQRWYPQIRAWKAAHKDHIAAYNAWYYEHVTKPKRQREQKEIEHGERALCPV